jgi:hypothetical protein
LESIMADNVATGSRTSSLGRGAAALVVAGGFALATWSGALAEEFRGEFHGNQGFQGSQEDQQACHDDVFRLCGEFVPDAERIVTCLKGNKANLSPACKAVFSRGEPPPPPPRKKPRRT